LLQGRRGGGAVQGERKARGYAIQERLNWLANEKQVFKNKELKVRTRIKTTSEAGVVKEGGEVESPWGEKTRLARDGALRKGERDDG